MKKSIVAAGVSAVALAAMPVVGVFAEKTTQTDTIDVILATTCTMNSVTHAVGTASSATSWSATGDVLTANAVAGAAYENIGSTEFNIVCNNKNGWNVSTVTGALTGKTTPAETIPLGTVAPNTTFWSYTPSTDDTSHITLGAANTSLVATSKLNEESSHATGNAGRTFTVTYAVSTANDISAQTYEGTIAYTLNQAS